MPSRLDLTGNIYGELMVAEMLYKRQKSGKMRTYCRCVSQDNTEVVVRADALQSGATKSIRGAGRCGKPIDLTGMQFGLLTIIRSTDRRTSSGSIIWECMCKCGNITYVSASQLTRHHTMSCGCRHQSKWEMFIGEFLKSINIDFVQQKRFLDCMNSKQSDMLPFDFYIPSINTLIEYDGEHHYFPIKGWGGEDKFKITQENDKIKNDYCLLHNITLLRLPYTYTENKIKDAILNILSPVTTTA